MKKNYNPDDNRTWPDDELADESGKLFNPQAELQRIRDDYRMTVRRAFFRREGALKRLARRLAAAGYGDASSPCRPAERAVAPRPPRGSSLAYPASPAAGSARRREHNAFTQALQVAVPDQVPPGAAEASGAPGRAGSGVLAGSGQAGLATPGTAPEAAAAAPGGTGATDFTGHKTTGEIHVGAKGRTDPPPPTSESDAPDGQSLPHPGGYQDGEQVPPTTERE
jgi:hypothetical protein